MVRVRAADGVRLALHRIAPAAPHRGPPVLLVPGSFSMRSFWLGTRGQGFARVLAAAGFDTWILELRGHGESERPGSYNFDDWILRDAPAGVEGVLDRTGARELFWMGHSAGGVIGAGFVGSGSPLARRLCGLVMLGAPGPVVRGVRRLGARVSHLAAAAAPRALFPGSPLGLGPEREPAALIRQWMSWNLDGAWRMPGGGDYLVGLGSAELPVLAVAGGGDRIAPPETVRDLAERFGSADRTVLVAGKENGFSDDYGHAAVVVSRDARRELWPLLVDWLRVRARDNAAPSPTEVVVGRSDG